MLLSAAVQVLLTPPPLAVSAPFSWFRRSHDSRSRLASICAITDEFPGSEAGWMTVLSPNQFAILRSAATEPPGYSAETEGELEFELQREYRTKYPQDGAYACVGCGVPLYHARQKFSSGCGWPAFYSGVEGAIEERPDEDGSGSIEIVCANCKGHLGHVFKNEGFPTPTDERHCVNGICLRYDPSVEQPDSVQAVPAGLRLGGIPD